MNMYFFDFERKSTFNCRKLHWHIRCVLVSLCIMTKL